MPLSDYDFQLPEGLIAAAPLAERDASRLLVLDRATGAVAHRRFLDWPGLLRRGDVLVLNDTRVIPARLLGRKQGSGGRVELLLVRPDADADASRALSGSADALSWVCLGQASKGLRPGTVVELDGGRATVLEALGEGSSGSASRRRARSGALLERTGRVPLPPYISREPTDEDADPLPDRLRAGGRLGRRSHRRAALHRPGPSPSWRPTGSSVASSPSMSGRAPSSRCAARTSPTAPDARRALPGPGGDRGGGEPRAAPRGVASSRSGRRWCGPWRAPSGREGCGQAPGPRACSSGRRFRVPGGGRPAHQLPPPALDAADAGARAFAGREQVLAAYRDAVAERYRFFSYGDAMFIAAGATP